MCAFALMYIYHLKVKITLKVLFSKKKITHCIAKNMWVFFVVIIVNWMIIFLTKVRLNIWRLTHCPLEDVTLILCV